MDARGVVEHRRRGVGSWVVDLVLVGREGESEGQVNTQRPHPPCACVVVLAYGKTTTPVSHRVAGSGRRVRPFRRRGAHAAHAQGVPVVDCKRGLSSSVAFPPSRPGCARPRPLLPRVYYRVWPGSGSPPSCPAATGVSPPPPKRRTQHPETVGSTFSRTPSASCITASKAQSFRTSSFWNSLLCETIRHPHLCPYK